MGQSGGKLRLAGMAGRKAMLFRIVGNANLWPLYRPEKPTFSHQADDQQPRFLTNRILINDLIALIC